MMMMTTKCTEISHYDGDSCKSFRNMSGVEAQCPREFLFACVLPSTINCLEAVRRELDASALNLIVFDFLPLVFFVRDSYPSLILNQLIMYAK